ncbi:predicted protein [Uncinocarpus reesii 1704]|uniref:Hydrophobin n=1 Tax=Uncinocarpus reesii (strain UAMH 1704) TaxID=336963 RepID=C4JTT5_UNCRE|nr:uncharacterized protein UREG_05874 [Uncinocarpus reesii 1704]EEP81032.1 predicted protein [Uncinocarpus reesii 1704]
MWMPLQMSVKTRVLCFFLLGLVNGLQHQYENPFVSPNRTVTRPISCTNGNLTPLCCDESIYNPIKHNRRLRDPLSDPALESPFVVHPASKPTKHRTDFDHHGTTIPLILPISASSSPAPALSSLAVQRAVPLAPHSLSRSSNPNPIERPLSQIVSSEVTSGGVLSDKTKKEVKRSCFGLLVCLIVAVIWL